MAVIALVTIRGHRRKVSLVFEKIQSIKKVTHMPLVIREIEKVLF